MAGVAAAVDESRGRRGFLSPARKLLWLLGGVLLVIVGARWGTEVAASRRIQELEQRLKVLEAEQVELRRRAKRDDNADVCITRVDHSLSGWRFLRSDGSEAAFISVDVANVTPVNAEALALRRATEVAAQCVVNITVAERTGSLEVLRLSGEVSEVHIGSPCPRQLSLEVDGAAAPSNVTESSGGQDVRHVELRERYGSEQWASELMRAPAHALLPTPAVHEENIVRASVTYPEMMCHGSGNEDWIEVKNAAAAQFRTWQTGTRLQDAAELQVLVDSAVRRLSSRASRSTGIGECGMGRLCMSILAVLAGSPGGQLLGAHAIHSPLLTALLDVPWRLLIQSGWPLFGLLAQLQLRARQLQSAPATGAAAEYFRDLGASLDRREVSQSDLSTGLQKHEASRIAYLGANFLRSEEGREHASSFVVPGLCALASQLLSPEVGTATMPVDNALQQVQGFFRQAVQSIEDVQGTLDSPWPLYSILHLAALQHSGS